MEGFVSKSFKDTAEFVNNVPAEKRGKALSVSDMYGRSVSRGLINDAKLHDANFAFLTSALSKIHETMYEPIHNIRWQEDVPVKYGGGFVDYIEFYTVDMAGVMSEFRNTISNNANFAPRVNAGLTQKKADVHTFAMAYDIRFVELEKMNTLKLQKSLEEIYNNAIIINWDLFVEQIAYLGLNNSKGLFNQPASVVAPHTITIPSGSEGFASFTDDQIVSIINGIMMKALKDSNMNYKLLPDTFLLPESISVELSSRISALYQNNLREFLRTHNLGVDESAGKLDIQFRTRTELDTLGTGGKGRIVAYKKDPRFVRIDIPYPMQHYVTLPNIEKFGYTSAFLGQVSDIQLPYNSGDGTGIVSYWDIIEGE